MELRWTWYIKYDQHNHSIISPQYYNNIEELYVINYNYRYHQYHPFIYIIYYIYYIIYILYIYTNSHNSRVTTIPRCRRWIKKSFPGSPSSRAVWRWPSLTSRSLTDPFVAMLWLFDPLVTTNYGSPKNHRKTIIEWGYD